MSKIDRMQIPCEYSVNCGRNVDLMKNWPFCDVRATAEDFSQPATGSEKIEKVADIMRCSVQGAEVGSAWLGAKMRARSVADFTYRGWNMEF